VSYMIAVEWGWPAVLTYCAVVVELQCQYQ
jgi:hypothetical protein